MQFCSQAAPPKTQTLTNKSRSQSRYRLRIIRKKSMWMVSIVYYTNQRWEQRLVVTGTRHDFRKVRWGHNFDPTGAITMDTLEAFSWSTPIVRSGDEVVWETAYGYVVGKVVECRHYVNPNDMALWTAEIVERHLSQESVQLIESGAVEAPPWTYLTD